MNKILTKEHFNELSQAGKLGNYLRTWQTLEQVRSAGYKGWLTIQSKLRQSPHFMPWVTFGFVSGAGYFVADEAVRSLRLQGAKVRDMYFREVPGPTAERIIQFEAMLGPKWRGDTAGVTLCYELNSRLPLRDIRERGSHAASLDAQMLLRQRLSPESYDMLTAIWEEYPTAIIEATEFSERVGVFNQKLVVWEVRDF